MIGVITARPMDSGKTPVVRELFITEYFTYFNPFGFVLFIEEEL